jgi:hypothetical protein
MKVKIAKRVIALADTHPKVATHPSFEKLVS